MVWNPLTSPTDHVVLGGRRSPGLATIDGASSPRQWEERRGAGGSSGATIVFKGIKLARFKLELRLLTDQDFADWDEWRQIVQRPPDGQRPRALDIDHPITEMLGIRSVVVEDVLQPEQTGDGQWTIGIKLLEYREPRRAIVRPTGAVGAGSATGGAASAGDEIDELIESLSAQARSISP